MSQLSTKLPWELAQTKWPAALNPILANPILSGVQIDSVIMRAGVANPVNHLLSRMPQGWFLVDNTADARVWRSAAFNNKTLVLTSNADTTISLWVY